MDWGSVFCPSPTGCDHSTAGLKRRSQVAGRRSQVASRRSEVAARSSQVAAKAAKANTRNNFNIMIT